MSVAVTLLIVVVTVAGALRFFSVSQSPPGFYIDEAAISAQVICLRQSGTTLAGEKWPLFTEVLEGGYLSPSYLAPALVWTTLFGDSIVSFRSMTAFFSCLFIFGSFVLGSRFWRSLEAGWLCALAAALSPWAFQFARIAWDPSLVPAYLVWAFALFWSRTRNRHFEAIFSGILFAAAAYCYPPARLQIAIALPTAILVLRFRERKKDPAILIQCSIACFSAALVSAPLILETLTGEIQGRFKFLSVFNRKFLLSQYNDDSLANGFRALFENFRLLLSPDYLFFRGDENLRHSTGLLGILSWLDMLSIIIAAAFLILIFTHRSRVQVWFLEIGFIFIGYFAGILPAALTWESNPHALRSIGAVVFLVLGVGGSLSMLWRISGYGRTLILATAVVTFAAFINIYFIQYPDEAMPWFDAEVVATANKLKSENRLAELSENLAIRGIDYEQMAIEYYWLSEGLVRCPLEAKP